MIGTFDIDSELNDLARSLDIPDYLSEEAVSRYDDVAEWLSQEGSVLREWAPSIYPQGSFRLGTMVRPLGPDGEFDIDLVCRLNVAKERTTQANLKRSVGGRLQESGEFGRILEEQRRCWTLNYPGEFHLDVLPAIPDVEGADESILLTDKELRLWQHSSPIGYANWFFERMRQVLFEAREALAKSAGVSVEEIPEWRVRTPLQRSVQLLKRHRDASFESGDDRRPVSIIVTTLAAKAYEGEANIERALRNLVARMPRHVAHRNGKWWVENPANPQENFADKWNEKPERREAFLAWLGKLEREIESARLEKSAEVGSRRLRESFGVARPLGGMMADGAAVPALRREHVPALADSGHMQRPGWFQRPVYRCGVRGQVHKARGRARALWPLTDRPVPKDYALRFEVDTNAPRPYEVHWQVVNTGVEAARDLRGGFEASNGGSEVRWETTKYAGTHWVEAFVVKDGVCVARSGRRYVKIKA